ncbi:TetR/AcrR family transcriptional regulator [Rathayibacter sp. ZW T2_19]|uniref:TetR/AcrR family transcriptional regulator n=1 Tax=Rathayibacter rubneri TaxID=2950106 RepID=A0A9X2IT00_9MICO|nr:TetR/AcrR family transcriptional regulator [Rathayibacter rubneri]MCM6761144.1 TetR/AcrR family transcriptional regulator [Rathayibacter rubneri]
MENTDPRYVRSRLKLRAAMLEIADEDLEQLTVSAVCEKVGIDRATFYRHFATIDGLVDDTLRSLADESTDRWSATARGTGDQLDESAAILRAYLEQIVKHWALYRWALGPTGSARVIHTVLEEAIRGVAAELILLQGDDEHTQARAWFLGGGLVGGILHWLQTESPEREPAELAQWLLGVSSPLPAIPTTV